MLNNKCDSFVSEILKSIRCGIYSSGEHIPSERKLCEKFGLSRTTVRNGIATLIEQGIVVRTPQGSVTVLPQSGMMHESVLSPNAKKVMFIYDPSQMENPILQSIFNNIISSIEPDFRAQVFLWDKDQRELPSGIGHEQTVFVFGFRPEFQIDQLETIADNLIFLNSRHPRCHWVAPDNYAGGRLLAEYLYSCGHRRISSLFLGKQLCGVYDEFFERYQGARDFLWEKGIALNPLLNLEHHSLNDFQLAQNGYRLLCEQERPTAILTPRDGMAMAVYALPASKRQSIPEELSIVSFDDIPTAAYLVPSLTTIRYPIEALAAAAVDILHRLCNGERGPIQLLIPPRLFVRQSVKKIKLEP